MSEDEYGIIHRMPPAVHNHTGGPIDTLFLGPKRDITGDSHVDYVAEAKTEHAKKLEELRPVIEAGIREAVDLAVNAERTRIADMVEALVLDEYQYDQATLIQKRIADQIRENKHNFPGVIASTERAVHSAVQAERTRIVNLVASWDKLITERYALCRAIQDGVEKDAKMSGPLAGAIAKVMEERDD